jgi:hypothetical protein
MKRLTNRRRLLTYGQMRRAVMNALNPLVGVTKFDFIQHRLEGPNKDHIAMHRKQIFPSISLQLFFEGFVILIHRYGPKLNETTLAKLLRIQHLRFWHYNAPAIPMNKNDPIITALAGYSYEDWQPGV